MTPTLSSPTAFLLGMALSLLPALGPFSAALLLVSRRWTFNRRDLLWGAAAFAFGLAGVVSGGATSGLAAFATVVGPWIVFRTFVEMKHVDLAHARRGSLAWGLLAGFGVVIAMGLLTSITTLDLSATRTVADAIVWSGSPALFGHSVLVLGGLIALLTQEHRRVAWAAMGLAAFGIVVAGSLEAAIAWVGLATALIALRPRGARRPRIYEVAVLLLMIAIAGGLAPLLGWGRIGFLLPAPEDGAVGRNLLSGTEVAGGDWWDARWVDVRTSTVTLDGTELTAYDVTKRGEEGWLRLQQLVRLVPGTTYTLSGWIAEPDDAVPGFHGWGESDDGARPLILTATLRDGGTWSAGMSGPGDLAEAREIGREGAWRRVAVTFSVADSAEPLTWFVGFAPDTRQVAGTSSRVAGLMLEAAEEAGPYQPGLATSGLDFGYARAPLWRVAWDGIRERPLFGWGPGTFPELYRQSLPGIERQEVVPGHPHNLALLILFEKGVVGAIGMALLLASLFGLAVRYRDLGLLAVVAAILFANIFDATLLSGAVLYPLAAVAGWRSAMRGARRTDGTEGVRQLVVRVGLAGTDLLVAFVWFLAAQAVTASLGAPFELSAPVLYALLIWPAMAWREGLYPGYGLTPAQELKKQMTAWGYAAAIFVVGTRLFPDALGIALPGVAVLLAGTALGAPPVRAGTKRLLHAMRVWGRPVVILGAGDTGRRVARALKRTPLDGLHPIAIFDDRPELRTQHVETLRVRGSLDEAYAFARRHNVQHAIVAIPTLDPARLDRLTTGSGRIFRRVQFVPKLGGLPSEDVVATDLDGMLALEVRNGLFSPGNRLAKRTADLLGAGIGSVLISPLLFALWLLVRLDSPGGGFHHSERVGQDGTPFRCLKFRTMHHDAEERLHELLAADPARREEYRRWHKLTEDPRITRAGRFLRRTSLDELPQLWNVLKGQMSLVGPRPYLAREIPDMGGYTDIIFQAKPGMTGYWQVSARSTVSFAERLEMEARYVRNWSVWWDAILLVQTPLVVVRGDGKAK